MAERRTGHVGAWTVQSTSNSRFPYRVEVTIRGQVLLALRVQSRWPGPGQNIFCLREDGAAELDGLEVIEQAGIQAIQRRGPRISIVLDRAKRKRCDFLVLTANYKNRPDDSYERIYWQTQSALLQRRPRVRVAAPKPGELRIAIDSGERYPWRFTGSEIVRRRLDSGDYALLDGDNVVAVVERKTFENLLADIGVLPVLHQRLLEMGQLERAALVVEAPYEDFISPAKVHHLTPASCARAIAELYARHPRVQIVFCSNRKTANAWTASFFAAVQTALREDLTLGPTALPLPHLDL